MTSQRNTWWCWYCSILIIGRWYTLLIQEHELFIMQQKKVPIPLIKNMSNTSTRKLRLAIFYKFVWILVWMFWLPILSKYFSSEHLINEWTIDTWYRKDMSFCLQCSRPTKRRKIYTCWRETRVVLKTDQQQLLLKSVLNLFLLRLLFFFSN